MKKSTGTAYPAGASYDEADEDQWEQLRDPNFRPDPHEQKIATLNKTQRKTLTEGAKTVSKQDDAMWSALTDRVPYGRKVMLALTVFTGAFFVSS